jgi:uncharacterized protein (TIGR01777 family)
VSTIVVAGGSGFLGRHLEARLERDGHDVVVLTRHPRPGRRGDVAWKPGVTAAQWVDRLEGAAAVFNLAGENIGERRWNEARKRALYDSRIQATRTLVEGIQRCQTPPRVLVSASAMNYYPATSDAPVTEDTPPGTDVLAQVCVAWEREAAVLATDPRVRVVVLRSSLVLSLEGGALPELMRPFTFGLGATLGSGRQFMPWIHLNDWVELAQWLAANEAARGPFNLSTPHPPTNREFTKTLARAMHRPALFTVPGFALRLIVGEFAEYLLTGPRMLPARAQELGYRFKFPELEPALHDLFNRQL